MPQKPGTILENRYRVEALLGQGGMGAVYKAFDQRLQMAVALKENSLTTADARAQFEREALVLARLHHTNLPKVIDHFVTADGLQYLVMTFIEGVNLAELLAKRGRQTPAEVVTWLAQVCDALTYLHSQNPPIIHRDIKPQNIKITPDGHVFLVDFGLSKVGSAYQSTASGALGVTPGFSPWEQYGHGHTDQRSDVYALAATLYAMLTGEPPPDSVQRGLAGLALRPPRDLNPALSPTLEHAILHGLETQPTNRPPTVAALRSEVETSLAATGTTEVFVADGEGGNARPISNHPSEDDHPSWFPNNSEIAFASSRDGSWEVYRMRADGSDLQRLTWSGGDNRFSVVSPNGQQIAYLSQSGEYPLVQLVVMNADGSAPRGLYSYRSNKQRDDFSRYLYRPDWSPDGTKLAIGADDDNDGLISILVIDTTSGTPVRLIADGNSPAWSPDGLRVVYKPAGVRQVLYVADASGRRLYQLTDPSADAWSPDWSP